MAATKTPTADIPAAKSPRKTTVRADARTRIRQNLSDIAAKIRAIGDDLDAVRETFTADQTDQFLNWCATNVGLGKSAVYRYIKAASAVAKYPALDGVITSATGLEYLDRYPAEDLPVILREAKKNGDLSDAGLRTAAESATALGRELAKKKKDAAKKKKNGSNSSPAAQVREAASEDLDKTTDAIRAEVLTAMETCRAHGSEDLDGALRLLAASIAGIAAKSPNPALAGMAVTAIVSDLWNESETDPETDPAS